MTRPTVLSHLGVLPAVAEALPEIELVAIPTEGDLDPGVSGEVLLTLMRATPNLAEVLGRGVTWVHTIGTGVDDLPLELFDDRVLTCSRGATAGPIAEWIMAQILTVEKHLPSMWVHEPPANWGSVSLGGLAGRTIAIVGLGSIGQALARRALPFDARVRALRRSAGPSPVPDVDVVSTVTDLVRDASHVVLAAPSTRETRQMVDEKFLSAMQPGAHLVNVARADLIDETALRRALDSGHVGVASIDVAPVEPLPADHWFYEHPRVRFSPHVSWSSPGDWDALQASFIANCRRWLAGKPLHGVVDVMTGY